MISEITEHLRNKKEQAFMVIFSLLFAALKSLAFFVCEYNQLAVSGWDILKYGPICWLVLNILNLVAQHNWPIKPSVIKSPLRLWGIFFASLAALHTVSWLFFWPAIISHDCMFVLYYGMKISALHPITYVSFVTLLQNIGLLLGSVKYAVLIHIFLQICIVDAVIAYLMLRICQLQTAKFWKVLSVLYILFLPLFLVYGAVMIKDTFWTAALLILVLKTYDIIVSGSATRKNWIIFWVATVLVVLLRNNGIYIMSGFSVLLLLFCNKEIRKKAAITLGLAITAELISIGAMKIVGTQQMFQEKVSVPLQQIAATIKNNGVITEEQKQYLTTLMPWENYVKYYDPYSADTIKWVNPEFNTKALDDSRQEFMKVWWEMLPPNFETYVIAYLQASYWWWVPRQAHRLQIRYLWHHNNAEFRSYAEANNLMEDPIITGKIGGYLQKYYDLDECFLREGALSWIIATLLLLYWFKRKSFKDTMIYMPCFLLWLTIMIAAPVAQSFRYILAFAYLLPFYVGLLLTGDSIGKAESGVKQRKRRIK